MRKCTIIILLSALAVSFNWQLHAQNWDINTLHRINSIESSKGFSTFISESTGYIGIGTPVIMGTVALLAKNDDLLKNSLYIGATLVADGTLTQLSKAVFNRPRPYNTYPDLITPYKFMGDKSFPSGHTSIAFATATALTIKYPKWYVIAPSYLWACSVGYSRMNLGVHYPSDVIAGAILGAGSAYLTALANDWFWKKQNNKKLLTLQKFEYCNAVLGPGSGN